MTDPSNTEILKNIIQDDNISDTNLLSSLPLKHEEQKSNRFRFKYFLTGCNEIDSSPFNHLPHILLKVILANMDSGLSWDFINKINMGNLIDYLKPESVEKRKYYAAPNMRREEFLHSKEMDRELMCIVISNQQEELNNKPHIFRGFFKQHHLIGELRTILDKSSCKSDKECNALHDKTEKWFLKWHQEIENVDANLKSDINKVLKIAEINPEETLNTFLKSKNNNNLN